MANPTRSQMKETLKELKRKDELRRRKKRSPAEGVKNSGVRKDIPKAERNVAEEAVKLNELFKEKGVGILGGTKKSDGSYDFKVNKKDGGSICGRPTGKGFGKARRRS